MADEGDILLQAKDLVKIYQNRCVVNKVSLHVKPGEVVGLLGPNGAGKTTTFYMIVGLIKPNGGHIEFGGRDVSRLAMFERPPGHGLLSPGALCVQQANRRGKYHVHPGDSGHEPEGARGAPGGTAQ